MEIVHLPRFKNIPCFVKRKDTAIYTEDVLTVAFDEYTFYLHFDDILLTKGHFEMGDIVLLSFTCHTNYSKYPKDLHLCEKGNDIELSKVTWPYNV